jgi:hypothetical protein
MKRMATLTASCSVGDKSVDRLVSAFGRGFAHETRA